MQAVTPAELLDILVQCSGEGANLVPDEQFVATEFADMGFDSLALIEATAHIGRTHGLELSDDLLPQLLTPRDLLHHLNAAARVS
jgi:minimal PKS acyl carrier protein